MTTISIADRQIKDFETIIGIDLARFKRLADEVAHEQRPSANRSKLSSILKRHLDPHQAEILERQLLAISAFRRDNRVPASEFVSSLEAALKRESSWPEENFTRWGKIKAYFGQLLESDSVIIASKAMDLSFDHSNILKKGWIITDIRPIFGSTKEKISGALIANTLRLDYFSGLGNTDHKTLSLALDINDLELIRDACDEAIKKSRTSKEFMEKGKKVETSIVGDNDAS